MFSAGDFVGASGGARRVDRARLFASAGLLVAEGSGADQVEQPVFVHHQQSVGAGDAAPDYGLDDPDGQVAEGGHRLRSVASADPAFVLVVRDVSDVMKGFNGPVTTQEPEYRLLVRAVDGHAEHAIDDFMPDLTVTQRGRAFTAEALFSVGETQALDALRQLNRPLFDPTVPLVDFRVPGGKATSPERPTACA